MENAFADLNQDQRAALALVHEIEGARDELPPIDEEGNVVDVAERERRSESEREGVQQITKIALVWVFAWAAKRGGRHWELSERESASLSGSVVKTVFHYWPDLQFGPAAELLVVFVGITAPRVAKTRTVQKKREVSGKEKTEPETEAEFDREGEDDAD